MARGVDALAGTTSAPSGIAPNMSPSSTSAPLKRVSGRVSRRYRPELAPDVESTPGLVQTRLQQRRPFAIRRHAIRTVRRVALLMLGDLAATALTCVALGFVA